MVCGEHQRTSLQDGDEMKRVKTYIIYYRDEDDNGQMDYIQALSAVQAVDTLGIPHKNVVDVALVLEDWERSK